MWYKRRMDGEWEGRERKREDGNEKGESVDE